MNRHAVDASAATIAAMLIRDGLQDGTLTHVSGFVGAMGSGETPKQLVHYTTLAGLRGILASKHLWATHALFFNDRAEVQYGMNLCRTVLEELDTESKAAKDFRQQCLTIISKLKYTADLYAACFCEDDDLISQWGGYGGGSAGYAVSFDPLGVTLAGGLPIFRVQYDLEEQRYVIGGFLRALLMSLEVSASATGADPRAIVRTTVQLAAVGLFMFAATFKDNAFRNEREWRAIYPMTPRDQSKFAVQFRSDREALIPYITIPLVSAEADPLPVIQVRCGPSQKYEAPEIPIRYLLDQNGLQSATAERSRIPLRA